MKKTIILLGILCGLTVNAQNWSLTGNSGTTPGTNFVGTTDNQDLVFKTNNQEWLKITPSGRLVFQNIDTGYGWSNNLFLGGGNNTSTGIGNTVLGLGAFISNTTGTANVAVGSNALRSNISGLHNVSLGPNALMYGTTASRSIAIGLNSLSNTTVGNNNTAVGHVTLGLNITGNDNTAVGTHVLYGLNSSTAANNNTAVGSNSFRYLKSGNNNIALGYNNVATSEIFNANNNIYIGNNLMPFATSPNNELNIGNWIIGNNGTIGIGQFTSVLPSDGIATDGKKYKLFVKDGIKTEKIKVDISAENGWADYVFAKDYKLMPLKDVESYIQTNGHLPEVPSTEEAIQNGIELKEMNILLLKKVEELTLHLIDLNKKMEKQNEQIKSLESSK